RRLSFRSSKSSVSISEVLYQCPQFLNLCGGQILLFRLRISQEHHDLIFGSDPVVDDTNAATFPHSWSCMTYLSDSSSRRNQITPPRVSSQNLLQFSVVIVWKQVYDLSSEQGSFDEFHRF